MFKVHIDPGHYGNTYNKSTTGLNYYESAMTWKLCGYLKTELEKRNVVVTLSRQSVNANPSLYDRGYGAKGCDLFLSLHSNACGTESVDYPIVYRGYDKTKANDFAQKMANTIREVMGTKNAGKVGTRKGSSGEYYGVLRGARAAGLTYYYIIEHSFHTNTAATRWLMSDSNLRKLAVAEAELIVNYFNVSQKEEKPNTSTTQSSGVVTYTVQKGDTLSGIGKKTGVAWKTIADLNGIKSPYTLKVGQVLKIKETTAPTVSSTNLNYDLVFNATYYANKYPDLKAAFGYNTAQLLNHFKVYGMKEQRQAISTFNVKVYKEYNVDLQKAFGDDYVKYFEHFMIYGYKENRKVV